MAEPFDILLENPRRGRGGRFVKGGRRRRRRSSRRRRASSRRRRRSRSRRRNPSIVGAGIPNPRRRRSRRRRVSSRRRRSSRRRSYMRNPFRFGGGGNIQRTLFAGLGLAGGEIVGDLIARGASKFGVGKLLDTVKVPQNVRVPMLRILVGLFAGPLLKMARLPSAVTANFGAVNVASGILAMTAGIRQGVFSKVGLADYELADYELADYELADVLVGDGDDVGDVLVGFDDGMGGDMHDQDFYAGYDAMR